MPVVGFYHSDLPRLMGDRFGRYVEKRLARYVAELYRQFDSVLAPCNAMANRLRGWGVENVRVQPLGVDLTQFHPQQRDPAFRQTMGIPSDKKLLTFVGRNSREKNIDVLLATMRKLGSDYHLLLMGPGMPHHVPSNVTVVDRCCGTHEVAKALASSDALLHAGTRETFGLIAQEAMASGIPVVAARAGALAENVPLGAGILCKPLDPTAMAEACAALFSNDVAASGHYARRYVERHFNWDSVMHSLLEHYQSLCHGSQPYALPNTANQRQLLKWRPVHGLMIALALIAPLVLTAWLGGDEALQRVKHFPLGLLLLMLMMAFLCWNLNAARLRLMLNGRAGRLGQRGALGIELASKFALCATPGGSGGAATLLLLLARRGFPPAKGAAVFLVDQGCDLLFFPDHAEWPGALFTGQRYPVASSIISAMGTRWFSFYGNTDQCGNALFAKPIAVTQCKNGMAEPLSAPLARAALIALPTCVKGDP
ncbi:hypothetical protein HSBAA_16920 [Vreelandella sulfidaeris]|uniref:Glycosyltransferase subfamily 4-like N-terminal domain-containing protein n=1 Tax=Vreelandella sulfidaeris TaxID=115553 RepID=A0A455U312_9GAMM|nr:hypothetical protein HSBAA_16920 [Halomonas sulfidaeris]